ncbi:MAG: hypothetical protein GC162_17860 [Planctomycetes bacterium]|nr:hypothetical protein [Planctomycetota bacterium]
MTHDMDKPMTCRRLDRSGHHARMRSSLQLIGPSVLIAGLSMVAWGIYDIFVHGNMAFHFSPFAGMLLIFVGAVMTLNGYLGAMMRYQANEMAPVASDAVNDLAEGTQEGVRTSARAMASGLREGFTQEAPTGYCTTCGAGHAAEANFCAKCGKRL